MEELNNMQKKCYVTIDIKDIISHRFLFYKSLKSLITKRYITRHSIMEVGSVDLSF